MSSSSEKNNSAVNNNYQSEIELLKKALAEKSLEASFIYERQVELEDTLVVCQDKFERLYQSHRKTQSINQNLEEKLLKLVDRNSGEKAQLIGDCATLNIRLNQANFNSLQLQREIERYKKDITLAIHLLQCNPNSFITPSIKSLPIEIQSKLTSYMRSEMNSDESKGYHRIPTCDPSMSPHGSHKNDLSPGIVGKFLEDELKMSMKHCETCCCTLKDLNTSTDIQESHSIAIQTDMTALNCLRCNSNLNSPSHPNNKSSYMKKLRSSDSVFSECNLSDFTNSNVMTPPKKDDLTINPILSHPHLAHLAHHRMCERSKNMNANAQGIRQQRRNNTYTESVKNEQLPPINASTPQRVLSKDLKNEEIKSASNKTRNQQPSNVASSNGTKSFENFNKDLLKSIKNKNLKIVGPRICALRIHDDTIFVDGASDEVKSIPYSRRRTLVDDDLIENEENGDLLLNLHSSLSSIIMSNADDEIFSTNKTDSEKFNEIKKELQQSNITQVEETLGEGDTTSISESVNESAIMKHQRVAEWIQNNSKISLSPAQALPQLGTPTFEPPNIILEKLIDIDDDDEPVKVEEEKEVVDDREKLDLLQMEYNVKQFLLKQTSVYNDLHLGGSGYVEHDEEDEEEEDEIDDDACHYIKHPPQRTETNL